MTDFEYVAGLEAEIDELRRENDYLKSTIRGWEHDYDALRRENDYIKEALNTFLDRVPSDQPAKL